MSERTAPAALDSTAREVLGHFASGIAVVTANGPTGPVGLTCQSFISLSLSPLLVAFAPARTSRTWPLVREVGRFGVNVLSKDQARTSAAFARPGTDRFQGIGWSPGPGGAPVLDGACAWIACDLWNEYEGGDHVLAVGRVIALGADPGREPLVYHRSRYRELAPDPLLDRGEPRV